MSAIAPVRTMLVVGFGALAATGLLGGCGSGDDDRDLPDDAVAAVAGRPITDAQLQRAVVGAIAIKHSTRTMPAYLPADIDGCVADRRTRPDGRDRSEDELEAACERERDRHEAAALSLLIRRQWYRLEAKRYGLPIPTARQAAARAAAHAGVQAEDLQEVTETRLMQLGLATRLAPKQAASSAEAALAGVDAQLASRYRDRTVCADDRRVPECG